MITSQPAPEEHPEVPPPTGDAVPITTEPDMAAAERPGDDQPREAYADAERADIAEDEAEAARRHHG
jgi:hypothetical protein